MKQGVKHFMAQKQMQGLKTLSLTGANLLATPLRNKGTAFSAAEREAFQLTGLIPPRIETIEQQAERAYLQYGSFSEAINKHIYLRMVQDTNETLFYFLLNQHLEEMMPIIYTPTVGEACEKFSQIYRRARGLFISYPDQQHIDTLLDNFQHDEVRVIVVTDGSRILGLGDQGAGGMGIPIGKLSLYTACGGIDPAHTLPIMLDVGTDNPSLLNDPRYIGWQHPRIHAEKYDLFLEKFITAIEQRWPDALLQFEDFEQRKALPLLNRYRDRLCCFNDDIQGTAAVTVGTLLAACQVKQQKLSEQTIVFAGAGSAGCGIAEQIVSQMCREGLSESAARQRIFMVDRQGLLRDSMPGLFDFQARLAQSETALTDWPITGEGVSLQTVIEQAKPTVLIGVSGQAGLFNKILIKTLYQHCQQPIIFPLSNPSKQIEAHPKQLIEWTEGHALIATGSPFLPVDYAGKVFPIAQCNNSYIFPGFGLAVVAAKIRRISDEMLMTASSVLAEASPCVQMGHGGLLPSLSDSAEISKKIAFAVAKVAIAQQHAPPLNDNEIHHAIETHFWLPSYHEYLK